MSTRLKSFFVLILGASAILLLVLFLLGLLVDTAVDYIEPELEAELFADYGGETEPQTEQEQTLQVLMDELGQCMGVTQPVVVNIQESELLNAFAMPGGQVVVFSALLDEVKTETGQAFVLAHELAHYQNRDHLRGLGRSVVVLAVSVLVTGANSDVSSLLTPIYGADLAQYSQERESDADAMALHAVNCRYGHVGGATEFFERVTEPEEGFDWAMLHYFSSHPEAQTRIDNLNALAENEGYAQ